MGWIASAAVYCNSGVLFRVASASVQSLENADRIQKGDPLLFGEQQAGKAGSLTFLRAGALRAGSLGAGSLGAALWGQLFGGSSLGAALWGQLFGGSSLGAGAFISRG